VRNFLIGNALFWIERYGVDGLRVDAVASMLYRDYSREGGEWLPNVHGGRENLEAVAFLRRMNEVGSERPARDHLAEESTAWPMVSRPTSMGGLGFHYKWNMGWMHDTLDYMAQGPGAPQLSPHQLSFGLMYAFTENFVLPLSHDEVVHGKGSLLSKMPATTGRSSPTCACLYGFMWAHPGKKLLFMGGEIGQWNEWNHDRSLDWGLLDFPLHAGMRDLIRDLNGIYRSNPALHQVDFEPAGFEWMAADDAECSVVAFVRWSRDRSRAILYVGNFTPVVRHGVPAHGREWSVNLTLPPLAALYLEWMP
jgi:1,4-alpha-glucan branching enzyme